MYLPLEGLLHLADLLHSPSSQLVPASPRSARFFLSTLFLRLISPLYILFYQVGLKSPAHPSTPNIPNTTWPDWLQRGLDTDVLVSEVSSSRLFFRSSLLLLLSSLVPFLFSLVLIFPSSYFTTNRSRKRLVNPTRSTTSSSDAVKEGGNLVRSLFPFFSLPSSPSLPSPHLILPSTISLASNSPSSHSSRSPTDTYPFLLYFLPFAIRSEIFARKHNTRPGWLSLGNQIGGDCVWEPSLAKRLAQKYPERKNLAGTAEGSVGPGMGEGVKEEE